MTRQILVMTVALTLVPIALIAQEGKPKRVAPKHLNQVYIKIILPSDPADKEKNPRVVESWIAKDLKKLGEETFCAATDWVPVIVTGEAFEDPTLIWEGGCRVHAEITERKDGQIKIFLDGWAPVPAGVTVSMPDEPGSREIKAAEKAKTKEGFPYVAVLIGPPQVKANAEVNKK